MLAAGALALTGCGEASATRDGARAAASGPSRASVPPSTAPPASVSTPASVPPTPRTSGADRSQSAPAGPERPDLPADLDITFAGVGARGAWVLRRDGEREDPVVLFIHGWTAVDPELYGPWLTHLVRSGSTVVYPVYQDLPFLAPAVAFGGVVAGVRSAIEEADLPRDDWVVAGHSAGGAMSADYAASARKLGLPPARGVFAAYPGRRARGIPLELPEVDPARIPASTRLIALYGADDQTVGARTAKRTISRAKTVSEQLIRVDDPAVDDHLGPQRSGPATRRRFWRRLDALISAVRR